MTLQTDVGMDRWTDRRGVQQYPRFFFEKRGVNECLTLSMMHKKIQQPDFFFFFFLTIPENRL